METGRARRGRHERARPRLRRCFAYIEYHELGHQCLLTEYPVAIMAASVDSYQWARWVKVGPLVAKPLHAKRGITASSSYATYELKAMLLVTIRQHN